LFVINNKSSTTLNLLNEYLGNTGRHQMNGKGGVENRKDGSKFPCILGQLLIPSTVRTLVRKVFGIKKGIWIQEGTRWTHIGVEVNIIPVQWARISYGTK